MPSPHRAMGTDYVARYAAERSFAPPGTGRVGLELEFLTFPIGDRARRPTLSVMEAVAATVALPAGGRVTFEPGGQLELSTAPQADAAAAIAAAHTDLAVLTAALSHAGVELVAQGSDGWRTPQRLVDSARYRAMEAHFDNHGSAGRVAMCNTASLQVNLDLGSAASQPARWRAAHALGPVLVAAFANSPLGVWKSHRLATWLGVEPARTAAVPTDSDPATAWARYALDAPVLLAGDAPLAPAVALRQWMAWGSEAGYPDEADLAYHLTTLFPPVRPRGWLEVRYIDALRSPWWEVAVTVVAALLADDVIPYTLSATADVEDRWLDAARYALDDRELAAAADACFDLAVEITADPAVDDYRTRYVARREPAWA